ncbi:MAG: SusC/RagA family TonB-linked outer membrane protein [Lutibacter sp.]|nr:SusC/RagA family TonB-linked outer membrane protein [Lutibacter sp.]MBP9600719.1 SusC/RagA family TonB-linked outer membrane protein [Lutibacter sp.]
MKNYKIKLLSTFFVLMLANFNSYVNAQDKASLTIQTVLVDENDKPIPNALIVLGDGLVETHSDLKGYFSLQALANNIMLISANGYESKTIYLKSETIENKIILKTTALFNGEQHVIKLPANIKTTQRALTGAVSSVSGKTLESQPDVVFQNALQGRLAGVSTQMTTNGLGNNLPNIYVRGLGRESANTALTIVDGMERPLEFLTAEEIESVEVLKDATAKILYGPRAANGVILITTKKGRINTQVIKTSVEYGVNMSTRMAEYLNSGDYATLYNEALANDGYSPKYSAAAIAGYYDSTGENDQLYPNIDHNSYFLNETSPLIKANFEYSGGTEESQYGVFLGYIGTKGLEKIGEKVAQDRINVRGNLDFKISDNLSGHIEGNGIIESRNWGKLGQDQIFGKIVTERPNEFPLLIQDPNFSGEAASLGDEIIPPLGGSLDNKNSLYGDMIYGGFQEYQFFYGQTNFGLDWDLNNTIKGVSASTSINFDNYQYHAADQISNPIRYSLYFNEDTATIEYDKLNKRTIERDRTERSSSITRSLGWTTNLKYELEIDKDNKFNADLSYFYYLNQNNSRRQHIRNTNTALNATYAYKNKWYFDVTYALMGSNKFASNNELFLSHALGAAWVLSEESFLKNNKSIDFLKLKSSYGVLGYDAATDFYLFETRYSKNGTINLGERNTSSEFRIGFDNFGNPNLAWEKSAEFNVGIEGLAFNKSLQFELNYFDEQRDDIIYSKPSASTTTSGGNGITPENLGAVANRGFDGSINWFKNYGDLKVNFGANFLISKNKVRASDAINNIDSYLNVEGRSSDVIFGYVSNGLFKTQQEVADAPVQTLGAYGIGNISYKDLNDDGVINEQDKTVIGNSFPRSSFGVNFDSEYKGFGLSILGVADTGVDFVKSNSYYRNSGEGKYSVLASDRFHPVNNPKGTQPMLTTLNPINDNVTSTFWMENGAFFRLKNVELSYKFSNDLWLAKTTKFYVRGTNLFVLSSVKDLDPEVPNSGVSNYPLFRTITAGVTVAF